MTTKELLDLNAELVAIESTSPCFVHGAAVEWVDLASACHSPGALLGAVAEFCA